MKLKCIKISGGVYSKRKDRHVISRSRGEGETQALNEYTVFEILEKCISSYDWLKHTKIFKWTVYKSSRIYDRGYVKKMCGRRMDSRLKLVLTQGLTKKKHVHVNPQLL